MGLIKSISFSIVAVLLFVSLLSMNTFWSISKSLEYDTLQPILVPLATDLVLNQTDISSSLEKTLPLMQLYCVNNSEFVIAQDDFVLDIPCDNINEGMESILDFSINKIVEDVYYREYDCKFWNCGFPPYHLISQKAQVYWGEWFYLLLTLSVILGGVTLFLMENRKNFPFILGGLLILSSLIFSKISWVISLFGKWEFMSFVEAFFTKAYNVFVINLILGIVLILVGFAIKFLSFGDFMGKIFNKNKKD